MPGGEQSAGCLGEVPAVLPLQGSKQALKVSQGASTRLRAPRLRGNPPSNRLQLLSPVLGFAPARHGTAPPPPQAEQCAKPGCSTRLSVWHGSADLTVAPVNAAEIVKQWADVHGLAAIPSREEIVDGYSRRVWTNAAGEGVPKSSTSFPAWTMARLFQYVAAQSDTEQPVPFCSMPAFRPATIL